MIANQNLKNPALRTATPTSAHCATATLSYSLAASPGMANLQNPFLTLFASREEATLKELSAAKQKKELCGLLTRIFLFTGTSKFCNLIVFSTPSLSVLVRSPLGEKHLAK